jgi:inner membrane protein
MTGPSHAVGGIAAFVAVSRLTGVEATAVELLVCIVGALAPDIDTNGTIARPGTVFRVFLGWKLGKLVDKIFRGISAVIKLLFGHRGFIHAPILAAGFVVLGLGFEQFWLAWFGCGYASHLLGDMMTPAGIAVLSPISAKRINLAKIRSGSAAEVLITTALILFVIAAGWGLLPERVKASHRAVYQLIAESQ